MTVVEVKIPLNCFLVLLIALSAGCASRAIDKAKFDSLTDRRGMGHLFYIGTEGQYHYLVEKYFLESPKKYHVLTSDLRIANTFPKTSDQNKWVPWLINLNEETEGFRGEEVRRLAIDSK